MNSRIRRLQSMTSRWLSRLWSDSHSARFSLMPRDFSYGETNARFQKLAVSFREFSTGYERLWRDVSSTIEAKEIDQRKFEEIAVALAKALVVVSDFAESRAFLVEQKMEGTKEDREIDPDLKALLFEDREAFRMISNQGHEFLVSSHVSQIVAKEGDQYDPTLHDCGDKHPCPSRYPRGVICRVVKKGYVFEGVGGRSLMIRPVDVEVSAGSQAQAERENKKDPH